MSTVYDRESLVVVRPSSVWEGSDSGLLDWAIPFYGGAGPHVILDATWGLGTFWKGSTYTPTASTDLDGRGRPSVIADNRALPFRDSAFSIVVYDPPHLSDHDTPGSSKLMLNRYGDAGRTNNVSHLFLPFFVEAWRVCKPHGIVLCKIADMVHNGKSQWQHVDMMKAAEACGFEVDDLIVKVRKSAMISGAWKNAYHARKRHSFFLILKKGR